MVKVSLRDNAVREYPAGTRIADIVEDLGGRLKKEALAALANGVSVICHFNCRKTPG